MKHMALVEEHWFSAVLLGNELGAPWAGLDWEADPDWEFRTAADDSPPEPGRLFDEAVAASGAVLDRVISEGGLERLPVKRSRARGEPFSLRWILLHMIEEYARHNGHADLIRESIDGEHRRVSREPWLRDCRRGESLTGGHPVRTPHRDALACRKRHEIARGGPVRYSCPESSTAVLGCRVHDNSGIYR